MNDKETCTNLIAIRKVEKPSIILSLRDKKENSSNYKICRICYENETEEKPKKIKVTKKKKSDENEK